jgi:hypothetical protein
MKTIFDEAQRLFVHEIVNDGYFNILVSDGEPEAPVYKIHFDSVIAWQGIDEIYTTWDEYEQRDATGYFQELTRSRFLDYLHLHHGWLFEKEKGVRHFRICAWDYVVDVVTVASPVISPLSK